MQGVSLSIAGSMDVQDVSNSTASGLAGCIPFHRRQYGRAGCIHFHSQWTSRVYPFPPQAVWTCRMYPFPQPMDVQGVSLSTAASSMDVQGVTISKARIWTGIRTDYRMPGIPRPEASASTPMPIYGKIISGGSRKITHRRQCKMSLSKKITCKETLRLLLD